MYFYKVLFELVYSIKDRADGYLRVSADVRQILSRIPEELIVLEAPDIRWSDWGTRESIERTYRHLNLVPALPPLGRRSEYGAA